MVLSNFVLVLLVSFVKNMRLDHVEIRVVTNLDLLINLLLRFLSLFDLFILNHKFVSGQISNRSLAIVKMTHAVKKRMSERFFGSQSLLRIQFQQPFKKT